MGGQTQALFASMPGMLSERSDRLRPIAMAERKRSALLSGPADHGPAIVNKLHGEIIAILASGLKGFGNWAGLLAPAGLDPRICTSLPSSLRIT
jgi:hypothetical protein